MLEKIKKYKEWYLLIVGIISLIFSGFMFLHNTLNKNEEILATIKTTQQMALKSVIWNEEIPLPERASACDTYLAAGYNSLTKKECEKIIEKGVSDGIFSYVERNFNYEHLYNSSYYNSNNLISLYAA